MQRMCFAAPIPAGQEDRVRSWLAALTRADAARDALLRRAGIRLERGHLTHSTRGPLAVVGFAVQDPAHALRILDAADEPWTRSFWGFLQRAEPFHPEPESPLDRLLADAAPSWAALRDDLR